MDRILVRSLPLADRVGMSLRPSPEYERDRAGRMASWAQAVAPDDPSGLRRRIDRLGVSWERLGEMLRGEPADRPTGEWVDVFEDTTASIDEASLWLGAQPLVDGSPLAEVLRPFVACAHRRLRATVPGAALARIQTGAIDGLLRSLAEVLHRTAAAALDAEFRTFRVLQTENEADLYEGFVRDMGGARWLLFFEAYPVLARLLSQATASWVASTSELLRRLDRDRPALAAAFDGASGDVVQIWSGLSDPHRGGRTVAILAFADGARAVYKPRDLTLEAVFAAVVERASGRDGGPELRAPGLVLREAYGWMEFIEAQAVETPEAAERYHARLGALLGLAHGLCATDLHIENVIGAGEHPVLIDLEALASPSLGVAPDIPFNAAAWERLSGSVLQTGLLPAPQGTRPGHVDVSALGGEGDTSPAMSGPLREAVVAGFEAAYRFLMADRETLTAPGGPLAPLRTTPVRFLLRHTRSYGRLLRKLTHPRYLRDGLDRSLALDALARPLLTGPEDPVSWDALRAEVRDLDALDIPLFHADPVCGDLDGGGDVQVEGCFEQSGYDRVEARLRALCDDDLDDQCTVIRHALTPTDGVRTPPTLAEAPAPDLTEASLDAATRVYAELARTAVRSRGEATWMIPDPLDPVTPSLLRPMGPGLYKGVCGVALFLAAYARVAEVEDSGRLALDALRPVRKVLGDPEQASALADRVGIGGGGGMGAIAYALVRTADLLDAPDLLDSARLAADRITPDRIRADASFDVLAGAAGAIHGLLAVATALRDDRYLDIARQCGEHLLANRRPGPTGHRAWATLGGELGGGAAHGASGIAHALLRLHRATGEDVFRDAALDAFAFERSLYLPEQRNWRSTLTMDPDRDALCAWCHGAVGIVLARVDGPDPSALAAFGEEVAIGLGTLVKRAAQAPDSLCCGAMGRIDALLLAGHRLDRPDLCAEAEKATHDVVDRVRDGDVTLTTFRGHRSLGLFQGSTGVGYGLLRSLRPDLVPSVLVWGNSTRLGKAVVGR